MDKNLLGADDNSLFFVIFASIMGNNKESNMDAGVGGYNRVIKYLGIFGLLPY